MPTVVNPPAERDADLQLLLNWSPDPDETARIRTAAIGTVMVHLFLILALAMMPHQGVNPARVYRPRQITKLIDPPTELTQKAPNKGKPSKEIVVQEIAPSIPVPVPAPGAQARRFAPPPTPQPAKQPVMAPAVVEPPKLEQAQANVPQISLPQLPQIQPQERPAGESKPKLAFENPAPAPAPTGASGNSRIPVPGSSVQDAVRELSRNGTHGISGSDAVDLGSGAGLHLPPSPGRPRMDYELKSDPLGVDFKPYILQVLANVRRNWFAVYPESAKLGTRGQVKLDFAIAKDGKVTKVAFAYQSGAQALDHAAVAAVSASNPLPPLPAEFKGDRIVLSFTFSYNMGR